jgi:acetyl-CoA carboxylase biotin carboxyl carrier protein
VSAGITGRAASHGLDGHEITEAGPSVPESAQIEVESTLGIVCKTVAEVLASAVRPPRRLRIQAGDACVELEWPDPVPAPAPPAAARQVQEGHPPPPPKAAPPVAVIIPDIGIPDIGEEALVAPMVGVLYRSPQPGAPPFASEGDVVVPGQQVAIIEAMKLMIPVEADRGGRITAVLVSDQQSVEYGQPLFTLVPDARAGGVAA